MPILENPAPAGAEAAWKPRPQKPKLRANEVHIWRASLDDPRLLSAKALETLSLRELIRGGKRDATGGGERYLALRVFLRTALSRYLVVAPEDVKLPDDVCAKPMRLPLSTLYFCCGESDGLALVAISATDEFGMDVERVREDLPFDEMAAHFFDPQSQWSVRTLFCRKEKAWKFFDFWTTSEACSKAKASAMQQRPTDFFSIHRLLPASGFLAALAVHRRCARVALWDWR